MYPNSNIRSEGPYHHHIPGYIQLRPGMLPQHQNLIHRPQFTNFVQNPNPLRHQLPPVYSPHVVCRSQPENCRYRPQQPIPQIPTFPTNNYPGPAVPFINTPVCQPPQLPPRPPKHCQYTNPPRPQVLESPKENVPFSICTPPRNIDFPNVIQRYPDYSISPPLVLDDRRFTTLIAEPSFTREHKLCDIPEWKDTKVIQLSREIYEHICKRLDNMTPTGATRNFRDLALRTPHGLESIQNTTSLLQKWNPSLAELIEILQEMECRQLISEIIEKLKNPPFRTFQPPFNQNLFCPRNMSEFPPSHSVERFDRPPIPKKMPSRTNSNSSSLSSSFSSSPRSLTPEIKPEIYVSYHDNDEKIGEEILRRLKEAGLNVACREDLPAGSNQLEGTSQFLSDCKRVIGVITPSYLGDELPLFEGMTGILKSITGKKRTFIPIQVEKTDDLPTYFKNIKAIKWSAEDKWEKLIKSLRQT